MNNNEEQKVLDAEFHCKLWRKVALAARQSCNRIEWRSFHLVKIKVLPLNGSRDFDPILSVPE
jgi:hypothetical protein